MHDAPMKLRNLSPAVRFGLTCLLLVMLGGMLASAAHMYLHHSVRDEQPGLTMDDLRGAYHGVRTVAPMLSALQRDHPWEYEVDEAERLLPEEREALLEWLNGTNLRDNYGNLDLGDAVPEFEVTSRTRTGLAMSFAHRTYPLFGVQFHPESIGTLQGPRLLQNFLSL